MSNGINAISASQLNRALVMKLICTNTEVSRVWLARKTGLSRMTLSNIVNEFMQKGFIVDESEIKTDDIKGRSPVRVTLSDDSPLVAGLCISEDSIECVLMDLRANIVLKLLREIPESIEGLHVGEELKDILNEASSQTSRKVIGVGIASLKHLALRTEALALSGALGIPVFCASNGIAGATAELYYGTGREISDFICIDVKESASAGLVIGGMIVSGSGGNAGDLSGIVKSKGDIKNILGSIKGILHFLDPEAVVIGGTDELQERYEGIRIKPSGFGKDLSLIGAASLVAHEIFTGEMSI